MTAQYLIPSIYVSLSHYENVFLILTDQNTTRISGLTKVVHFDNAAQQHRAWNHFLKS